MGLLAAGISAPPAALAEGVGVSVGTHYFAVRGRLRLGTSAVQELSLVERNGQAVQVIWRQREALAATATASLQ